MFGKHIGEVHQAVGHHDDVIGVLGVGHGIAQGTAVALAADAAAVAHAVAGGSGHHGDIDVHLAGLDGAGTAAVAADDGRGLQFAGGDDLADLAADTAGLNADHLAVLNVLGHGVMGLAQGGGGDGDVIQAQLLNGGLHDHVDHEVAVAQVMMEGEGHAALGAHLLEGVHDAVHDLALLGLFIAAGAGGGLLQIFAVHIVFALVDLAAILEQIFRNIASYCVLHTKSPSYMPQALASLSVRSAPGMKARSTILPLTVNTPMPCAAASRKARTQASA